MVGRSAYNTGKWWPSPESVVAAHGYFRRSVTGRYLSGGSRAATRGPAADAQRARLARSAQGCRSLITES